MRQNDASPRDLLRLSPCISENHMEKICGNAWLILLPRLNFIFLRSGHNIIGSLRIRNRSTYYGIHNTIEFVEKNQKTNTNYLPEDTTSHSINRICNSYLLDMNYFLHNFGDSNNFNIKRFLPVLTIIAFCSHFTRTLLFTSSKRKDFSNKLKSLPRKYL